MNVLAWVSLAVVAVCVVLAVLARSRSPRNVLGRATAAETVLSTMSDLLLLLSPDGRILRANRALLEVLGYDEDDLIGREVDAVIPDWTAGRGPSEGDRLTRRLTRDAIKDAELVLKTKEGGQVPASLSVSAIPGEDGRVQGVVCIARDITERKRAEAALQESERRYRMLALSNAELEQFTHVASHHLQEPLRQVSSYVQLLGQRYRGKLDADADEFIGYAVEGAHRMGALINDFLAYTSVTMRGKPLATTHCETVLVRAVSGLATKIEESGAVITHDRLPTVPGDGTQLVQLFQHLLDNAIKFRRQQSPRIHVSAQNRGSEWLLSVSDDGMGISPEYCDRIFMVFQRLHGGSAYAGTGIGLAICKKIVERHGGRIWVESTPGEGSTFYFTIRKTA